jgi:hypothetical protein
MEFKDLLLFVFGLHTLGIELAFGFDLTFGL